MSSHADTHSISRGFKKQKQDVRRNESANTTRFTWPDTIVWKDQEIKVSVKNPNHAVYMMGQSHMNRKLYLDKPTYLRWKANH